MKAANEKYICECGEYLIRLPSGRDIVYLCPKCGATYDIFLKEIQLESDIR